MDTPVGAAEESVDTTWLRLPERGLNESLPLEAPTIDLDESSRAPGIHSIRTSIKEGVPSSPTFERSTREPVSGGESDRFVAHRASAAPVVRNEGLCIRPGSPCVVRVLGPGHPLVDALANLEVKNEFTAARRERK